MGASSMMKTCVSEELERIARGEEPSVRAESEAAANWDLAEPVYCPETGAAVSRREAVCEKLRLYPLAQTNEIVASFARDGVSISSALVRRVRDELRRARGNMELVGNSR